MKKSTRLHKFIRFSGVAFIAILTSITIHSWYHYIHIPAATFEEVKSKKYDVIIVPGVPYDAGNWSLFLKWRVHWSVFLYKQGLADNLIYSGAAVHTEFVEANIMRRFGIELGIPAENSWVETQAEHSAENLYYSYLLARKKGFKKIALATDPFQSYLLEYFIEKHHLDIDLIPIVYAIADTINMIQPTIAYKNDAIKGFIPLKNREDFTKRMKGTSGQKIDWENLKKYRD